MCIALNPSVPNPYFTTPPTPFTFRAFIQSNYTHAHTHAHARTRTHTHASTHTHVHAHAHALTVESTMQADSQLRRYLAQGYLDSEPGIELATFQLQVQLQVTELSLALHH